MTTTSKPAFVFTTTLTVVLLSSTLCRGQPAKAAPAPVTGAITGRVLTSAGEPLPDAVVYAGSVGGRRRSQSARADRNGAFKIDGLTAGVYRVSAGLRGYVPSTQFGFDFQDFHQIGDHVTLTMNKGGVITGKVTGPSGPLVAIGVFAFRVRDEAGNLLPTPVFQRERATDDRGVYRIYGLAPGSYLVVAARPRIGMIAPSAYDNDTPTYFPSSPRDTAAEIIVHEGDELTADIQYRAEPGYAIRGQVLGVVESQQQFRANASVTLVDVRNRATVFAASASSFEQFSFVFTGVPDGEYELFALQYLGDIDESRRSAPRRVIVRGSDVAGVTLSLAKQAAIEGRLIFETDAKNICGKRRETVAQETLVFGRRYEVEKKNGTPNPSPADISISAINQIALGVGDATGSFTLRNLSPGTYRIEVRVPASGWYLRSIATRQPGPPRTAVASNTDRITVRAGETIPGLTVTFTEGAAVLRGQVAAAEGQRLPARTFVYLVPADKESSENLLRYFEAPVASDGSFALGNVAPGSYLIVALKSDGEPPTANAVRVDTNLRTEVRREAEKAKQSVTLKACERLDNYEFGYPPVTKP